MIPEQECCSKCDTPFNVRNTRTRRIITNIGERDLTEVTLHCPIHKEEVARPSKRLTPLKSKYGFDIITEIGKLRFLEHKQIIEIHDHYKKKGIDIPEQSINNLCQRFLQYVVAVHLESFPLLAKLIETHIRQTLL